MKKEMKRLFLVSATVGGALLIQGCGTTRAPQLPETPRPLPPATGVKQAPVKPVVKESVKVTNVTPPVVKPTPPVVVSKETTTYVVRKGDTLSQICKRYGVALSEVMSINSIASANKIIVGQKIKLPGKIDLGNPHHVSSAPRKSLAKAPEGSCIYVVKKGDCLSVIAHRAGVKTKAIREANGLSNDMIYVGKKLIIPGVKKMPKSVTRSTGTVNKPVSSSKPVKTPVPPVASGNDFSLPDLAPEQAESDVPEVVKPDAGTATGTVQYYIVKPDDNILSVASEFNVSIADLRSANNLTSDILTSGQRLKIPTKE